MQNDMLDVVNEEPMSINESLKNRFNQNSKMKISVIGVGNAGGQAAVEAQENGFSSYVINSSIKDLNSDTLGDSIKSYVIGNGRGCGKDRDISKAFYKSTASKIFSQENFTNTVDPADIIVIVGSSAGGTGSGCIPTLAYNLMQKYPDKTVTVIGYVPKLAESGLGQYNCIEFVDELEQLKIPYSLLDASSMEDEDNTVVHKKLATEFVQRIRVMRGDYFYPSSNDMIDESDTMSIFTQPGLWVLSIMNGITQDQLGTGNLQKSMIENFKSDVNVPIQKDKKISRMAVIFNSNNEIEETIKSGNYSDLKACFGEPPAVFTHNGNIESTESQMILIMSGLSMPYDRLIKCKEIVEKFKNQTSTVKSISEDKKSLGKFMKSTETDRMKILGAGIQDTEVDLNNVPDFLQ